MRAQRCETVVVQSGRVQHICLVVVMLHLKVIEIKMKSVFSYHTGADIRTTLFLVILGHFRYGGMHYCVLNFV